MRKRPPDPKETSFHGGFADCGADALRSHRTAPGIDHLNFGSLRLRRTPLRFRLQGTMSESSFRTRLKVFAPQDLSQASHLESQYYCAYACSTSRNGYTETTILIRKHDLNCMAKAWSNDLLAQQSTNTQETAQLGLHPTVDVPNLAQQLEACANSCSTCLLIYYVPSEEGVIHYVTEGSVSALSAVLIKIDEQRTVCQSCSMPAAASLDTTRCQYELHGTAACGGMGTLPPHLLRMWQLIALEC